jgi:DUF4097 and DUF4098 domain-containing protein YvlB
MKTLKTLYLIVILGLIGLSFAQAQEFRHTPKGNKLKILTNSGSFTIEGHSGKEIVLSGPSSKAPEEAEGLKLITGGAYDNTGTGLNIDETDGAVVIKNVARSGNFRVLVPEKMNLIIGAKTYNCGKITVSNFKAELEIKSEYGSIYLDNVTGPVVCNATYGKVKANFDQVNQSKPISIVATYSNVDVSLPESTKADVKLESSYGNIYSDITLVQERSSESDDWGQWGGKTINGKMNGGGVEIYLKSPYSNIYLRKKK